MGVTLCFTNSKILLWTLIWVYDYAHEYHICNMLIITVTIIISFTGCSPVSSIIIVTKEVFHCFYASTL